MMPRRWIVLGLLLAASVGLSLQSLLWTPESEGADASPGIVQPVERAQAATVSHPVRVTGIAGQAGNEEKPDDLLQLRARPAPAAAARDLFAAYSWQPALPPAAALAAAAAAAAVSQAPALPFKYGGRMEIDGEQTFLLLQDERTYRVAIGQSVGEFTLTSSGPQGLIFLHQPSGQNQVLAAPGAPVASN